MLSLASLGIYNRISLLEKHYLHTIARLSTSVMDPVETREKAKNLQTVLKITYHDRF